MGRTRWIGMLVGAALAASLAQAGVPASFSHDGPRAVLRVATSRGLVTVEGTADAQAFDLAARLDGAADALGLRGAAVEGGTAVDAVAVFGALGALRYELAPPAPPHALWSNLPAARCGEAARLPALEALREAYAALAARRPADPEFARFVDALGAFLVAGDVAADCAGLARRADHHGCDFPFEWLTCTQVGACCDEHDACYARNACNILSWTCDGDGAAARVMCAAGGGWTCHQCNLRVTACILSEAPGPSACCMDHTCGTSGTLFPDLR